MVTLAFKLRRQKQVDRGVSGQPGLRSEFQHSQGYTENPCLEKQTKKKKKNKQTHTINPPTSASLMLVLQVSTTTPS